MQAIPALILLILLRLSEAGLLRAARTESPNPATFSEFQISTTTPAPTLATFIISPPTSPTSTTHAQTTPGALPYGFVGVVQSSNVADPAPTEAPALNQASEQIVDGGSKFVQTTFWACETFPLETHCGWHEPILDVSSAAVAPHPRGLLVRAGVVAACIAGVLL
ncbi:hypothetical protein F4801DRAFT_436591 [Xylaria longipes]|nr:hypothetical protein F4801DRAFT_436591 [Xylaria longipes]